ncbi:predicted protein [Histoplasma mississippiense (nom. inval.)]|uniref:predicted protein n=1 Tax=Ajellomyces capsulatus (strain NAm1 / WU24) TaxID=2059318 RepID=UPI000157C639|nr:predicted protein [Histoplasma mississippiense (nom. inval.)]EDN08798.1 predicted protein [Histoplasma mississippiense (nom. inval.)]
MHEDVLNKTLENKSKVFPRAQISMEILWLKESFTSSLQSVHESTSGQNPHTKDPRQSENFADSVR